MIGLRRLVQMTLAEDLMALAAVRAAEVAVVLHKADDGHMHHLGHAYGLGHDHGDKLLRRGDDHEKAGLGQKYLSNIEHSISIPSIEVIMKLAYVLNTTPDEFLIGTLNSNDEEWKKSAELLRPLNSKQLNLVHNFLIWLSEQDM